VGVTYQLDRSSYTVAAFIADGGAGTANNYEAYFCAAAPVLARIVELFIQGEVNTANFMAGALRRHSTSSTAPTAKTPAKANPSSPANVGTYFQTVATTQPTISAGGHVFNCSIQAFGGLERAVSVQGAEWWLIGGNTNVSNEMSLSWIGGVASQISSHLGLEEM
jgi:hypothetical protein